MASVILAMRGCRVVYLGADTPIEQNRDQRPRG